MASYVVWFSSDDGSPLDLMGVFKEYDAALSFLGELLRKYGGEGNIQVV